MLKDDKPQMDVTAAVQSLHAAARVVTRIYNRWRLYITLTKWTKMPGQQKNAEQNVRLH